MTCLLLSGCDQDNYLATIAPKIIEGQDLKLSQVEVGNWGDVCVLQKIDDSIPVQPPLKFIEKMSLDSAGLNSKKLNRDDYAVAFVFIEDNRVANIRFDKRVDIQILGSTLRLDPKGNPKARIKNSFCYSRNGATFVVDEPNLQIMEK